MASARLTEVDPRRELGDFKGRYPQLGDDELLLTGRGWRTSPRTRAEHDQQADTPGGMDIVIPLTPEIWDALKPLGTKHIRRSSVPRLRHEQRWTPGGSSNARPRVATDV
jgi:hypothetical protein